MLLTEQEFTIEYNKLLNENSGKLYSFFSTLGTILNTDVRTLAKSLAKHTGELFSVLKSFSFNVNDFIKSLKSGLGDIRDILKVDISYANNIAKLKQITGYEKIADAGLVFAATLQKHYGLHKRKYYIAVHAIVAIAVIAGIVAFTMNPTPVFGFIEWAVMVSEGYAATAMTALKSFDVNTYVNMISNVAEEAGTSLTNVADMYSDMAQNAITGLHDYTVDAGLNQADYDFTGEVGQSLRNVGDMYGDMAQDAIKQLHDYTVDIGINNKNFDFTGEIWHSISNTISEYKRMLSLFMKGPLLTVMDKIR